MVTAVGISLLLQLGPLSIPSVLEPSELPGRPNRPSVHKMRVNTAEVNDTMPCALRNEGFGRCFYH